MTGSTFINIADFALLEYRYSTATKTIADYDFLKVKNKSENINLFLNKSNSATFSKNVLDFNSIRMNSGVKFGSLDQDRSLKLYDLDTNIELTSDLAIPTTIEVEYDTIRLHILAGYNLDGLDAISCQIYFDENTGGKAYVSNFTFIKGEKTITNASKPFNIGERLYDKYLEWSIPSLSQLNREFYAKNNEINKTLAYFLSSDGKGYKKESLINIEFYAYTNANETDDILNFDGTLLSNAYLNSYDNNALLSAEIRESTGGDYFEYFATYDGAFIEDYLAELNSAGNDYYIINELKVYENYGSLSNKLTHSLSFVQTEDFDLANKYRPIISNEAYSFSIDYTFRLINNADSTQIIKTSSISCDNSLARKYGMKLSSISVKEQSAPFKIYNRRVSLYENPIKDFFTNPVTLDGTTVRVAEVIKYTESYNISISPISNYLDSKSILTDSTLVDSNMVYGNDKSYIILSPFDNYIRLNIYNTRTPKEQPVILNFSTFLKTDGSGTEKVQLVFINDNGGKIYFDCEAETLKDNTVTFYIKAKDGVKLLEHSKKDFYLVYVNSQGNEVILHKGTYFNVADTESINKFKDKEKSTVLSDAIRGYQNSIALLDSKIKELELATANLQSAQVQSQTTTGTTTTTTTSPNVSPSGSNTGTPPGNNPNSNRTSASVRTTVRKGINTQPKKAADTKADIDKAASNANAGKLYDTVKRFGLDKDYGNPDVLNPNRYGNDRVTLGPNGGSVGVGTTVSTGYYVSQDYNFKPVPGADTNLGLEASIKDTVPAFMQNPEDIF